jgi:type II secretory pathway pseudopilin PulG
MVYAIVVVLILAAFLFGVWFGMKRKEAILKAKDLVDTTVEKAKDL